MRVSLSSNEEKFNKIEIVRNENENHYQIYIDGEYYKGLNFISNCKKCNNIELEFDLLENGTMKIIEREGIKS